MSKMCLVMLLKLLFIRSHTRHRIETKRWCSIASAMSRYDAGCRSYSPRPHEVSKDVRSP